MLDAHDRLAVLERQVADLTAGREAAQAGPPASGAGVLSARPAAAAPGYPVLVGPSSRTEPGAARTASGALSGAWRGR